MKKIKKGFTLIELVTTMGVGSILLATLSSFLIFTSRISTDYKESLNTSHNAYLMENTIKSYIENFKESIRITPFTFNPSYEPADEQTILTGESNGSTFNISYAYPTPNSFPKLYLRFEDLIGTDTIFSAKSLLKLSINKTEETASEYLGKDKYVFTITYTFKEKSYDLNFTYFL